MKFHCAVAILLGITATLSSEAFVPLHQSRRQHRVRPVRVSGLGWDNENFMNSLSGSDKDREDANDRYFKMSRYGRPGDDDEEPAEFDDELSRSTPGAQLTPEMIQKAKASHTPEEEASGGGKMFREMMARAKEQPSVSQSQYQQPIQPPPVNPVQQPMDPSNLSVEEQARMFREMMQQQQQPQPQTMAPPPMQQQAPPQSNYLQQGVDATGRRIGRNRDADAINNSADVYFAQLKRDSTLRNMARYRGDDDMANAVFADPSLQDIKLHVNPYMEEQRQKEREMLDTSPEEMILPEMFEEKEIKPKSYSGVSYKDKLQQMKSKRTGGVSSVQPAAPPQQQQAASPPPVAEIPTPTESQAVSPAVTEGKKQEEVVPELMESTQQQKETWAAKLSVQEATTVESDSMGQVVEGTTQKASIGVSEDSVRKDIRTLMGLILKHRGGPGFGAGRIQGAEAEKLESLASELSAFLRQEATQFPQEGFAGAQDLMVGATVEATTVEEQPVSVAAPAPASAIVQQHSETADLAKIDNLLSCIDGAILMYRNAPLELKEGVLLTLRAALLSAVNEIYDGEYPQQSPQSLQGAGFSQEQRIDGMLACVGGAIQMFRNSPPELRDSVLITLRAALLAAVNTCNAVIADNEVVNLQNYQAQQAAPAAVAPATTVASQTPATGPVAASDEKSQYFEEVLEKLKKASGNGRMGLRGDLTASEATELSDSIAQMRSMLIDELDTGVSSESSSEAPDSTSSRYAQMLAQAKARK